MSSGRFLPILGALATILVFPTIGAAQGARSDEAGAETYVRRTSPGEVSLDVRPRWEAEDLVFAVAANTHTVDLTSIDLIEKLRLIADGDTLRPTSSGRLQGHHAQAEVRFRLPVRPARFVLEIRDVPDLPVRRLSWPDESPMSTRRDEHGDIVAVGGIAPGGIAILDRESLRVLRTIDGLEAVHGAAVATAGDRVVALNMADQERAATVIDAGSGTVERVVALPGPGHHAAAGRNEVFVTYGTMSLDPAAAHGIAAIDPDDGEVRTLPVEGLPFYLAVDRDRDRLYVSVQAPDGGGRILAVGLPELEILRAGDLPGSPSHLVVSPDDKSIWVALIPGRLLRLDATTLDVVGDADVGPDAHAVEVAGAPERVFVASRAAGVIAVLDARTLNRVDELKAAQLPTHLLTLSDGRLLVSDGASKRLLVVDPNTLDVVKRIELPFQPHQSAARPS